MLLKKFEFITPEKHSGFKPPNGEIPIVKNNTFYYVDLGTIIGDAPKCMVALYNYEEGSSVRKKNKKSWKKYIAKSARKWYPNESITEHLLNELGRALGLNMANSLLRRVDKNIWFFSEYFLNEHQSLYHGADLYALHLNNDKQFVNEIQDNNKIDDQDYFTVQLVDEIFKKYFSKYATDLFANFIKMIIFDGITGNNDRHAFNWGLVTSIKSNESICFSPIYDTARGLYWNTPEENVKHILSLTDKKGNNPMIEKYVLSSRPKIGWEGKNKLSHIDLLKLIYDSELGISKENFLNLVSKSNLNKIISVIDKDFGALFSQERRTLIKMCLKHRFETINSSLSC